MTSDLFTPCPTCTTPGGCASWGCDKGPHMNLRLPTVLLAIFMGAILACLWLTAHDAPIRGTGLESHIGEPT